MAKVEMHPALQGLRGKIGDLVYRHMNGQVFVSRQGDYSRRKQSAVQKGRSRKFADAVRYAKAVYADPERKAAYAARAAKGRRRIWPLIISEFMRGQ